MQSITDTDFAHSHNRKMAIKPIIVVAYETLNHPTWQFMSELYFSTRN